MRMPLTSSSSAAASRGWRPRTSCTRAACSFVVLERRAARGRRDPERADRRVHDRRRAGRAARSEARRHQRSARSSASAIGSSRPSRRASRSSSAAAVCTRCRRHRCSASRRGSARSSATGLFSWPGKLRMGAELFVPPRRDEGDESIGAFMTRRFGARGRRPIWPSRCWRASTPATSTGCRCGALPAVRRGGAAARQPAARLPTQARQRSAGRSDGAFRSLPGGLSEMVRALVAALPPGTACDSVSPVRRVARDVASAAVP